MFEIIFAVLVFLYFSQIAIFLIGANKLFKKTKAENDLPKASVIVAARNEEENILDCVRSLDALEYPHDKLEIIIVDDFSEDKTNELVSEFIADKPKYKLIQPTEKLVERPGKANALANGIKISKGEIILTTDADCVVSPTWAKTHASYYASEDVAFVGGFTTQTRGSLFESMQALDFIFLLGVAGGTMNLGKSLSCIGNNMSFRRSVYYKVGGYESIPFSVTEDFALVTKIAKLEGYRNIYPLDKNTLVRSKACKTVKEIYWQKKRWGVGGLASEFTGYFIMGLGFLTNLATLVSPFFFSSDVAVLLFFKLLSDYLFLFSISKKLGEKFNLVEFLAFEIYYLIYVVALTFVLFFASSKVKWKEREY